mgnify:FL=1
MAYKPPKAYSDHAGRSMVEKQIKGVRHRKCLGRAGTPEARAAYEQFKRDYREGTVEWDGAAETHRDQRERPPHAAPDRTGLSLIHI